MVWYMLEASMDTWRIIDGNLSIYIKLIVDGNVDEHLHQSHHVKVVDCLYGFAIKSMIILQSPELLSF